MYLSWDHEINPLLNQVATYCTGYWLNILTKYDYSYDWMYCNELGCGAENGLYYISSLGNSWWYGGCVPMSPESPTSVCMTHPRGLLT